ncbi:MAG: TetR/AcrR family transcriptional regulator [Pseudomonadota bacterium]
MARFTKDDWLILGLSQLASAGPDALRLEALCEAAGRTKGSFYHHFPDHDDFIAAMCEHWSDWSLEVLDALDAGLMEGEARLPQLAAGLDAALEIALRRLPAASQALKTVDQTRLTWLADWWEAQGAPNPETNAETEYAALIGALHLYGDDPDKLRALGATLQSALQT